MIRRPQFEDLSIRVAAVADAREIGALIEGLSQEFITHEFDHDARERFARANDMWAIREALCRGDAYHLAVIRQEIVGVAGIRNNIELVHLFVAKRFHRLGIGRTLWTTALRRALAKGNPGLVTTNAANAAVGFYERLGFYACGPALTQDGMTFTPMRLVVDAP